MTGRRTTRGGRLHAAILGACLAAAVCLFTAGPAAALQYVPHTLEKTINGSETPSGSFGYEVTSVGVDQQSGSIYVIGDGPGGLTLFKFDAQGNPSAFTAPSLAGSSEIHVTSEHSYFGNADVVVDNSGGPYQGRIYVRNVDSREFIWAFEASGAEVGGNFPLPVAGGDIATNPANGNFFVTDAPLIQRAYEFGPNGLKTGVVVDMSQNGFTYEVDVGPQGEVFTFSGELGIQKYNPASELIDHFPAEFSSVFGVDPISGHLFSVRYEHVADFDPTGNELPGFDYSAEGRSIAINGSNHYNYLSFYGSVGIFKPEPAVTIPSAQSQPPTNIEPTSLTLNATVEPENVTTTECVFEIGTLFEYGTAYYNESAPCDQGQAIGGSSPTPVSATFSSLSQGATYHYRLVLSNPNGTFKSKDRTVSPSDQPVVENPYVDTVHSDSVLFHAEITPEGAPTTSHVLYGTGDCGTQPDTCEETPESSSVGSALLPVPVSVKATGLSPGTTYHYVIVATNQSGITESTEETFTTFPYVPVLEDKCANAHVRQQTGSALLADCRAYELVSAAVARYDVESYLTPEQEPFAGYPYAQSPPKVLYGVHDGAIPGSGHPTNHGVDPYIATRGAGGWSTSYVGVPANLPYSNEAFASPLAGADATLDTFAFGGAGLCSPCFADGTSGVPVAMPDGSLVQGMQGSLTPGPSATPGILVKKPLSADGRHLVFGSISEFESGAGTPAIYDRDLTTGVTHAVSKLPSGGTIPCSMNCTSDGLAELDISADGSRIVIGQLVSVDSAGNRYWHLYMNVGDSTKTIDLAPGATHGALYGGMTQNGSIAYFTTVDPVTGEDTDSSADLYEAAVGATTSTPHLVSKGSGGSGNSDACNPLPNSVNQHWNTPGASADCGVVAIGGGGAVAAGDGSTYFLSPELLDGSSEPGDGAANQPNLYRYEPGSSPHFVSTLESSATGPAELLEEHRFKKFFGATPNPEFVAVDGSGGPSDGDVYVADGNEQLIRKYDPEGNLITSWQDNGVFNPELPHEFSGIAVGPGGALWVAIHQELNSCCDIYKYDEDGVLLLKSDLDGAAQPIGIAVDNQERVYYEGYYAWIERWQNGSSQVISTWEYVSPPKTGIAVDPASGTLYVGFGGTEIARFSFDASGNVILPSGAPCNYECTPTAIFGAGEVSNTKGMFVDPTRHDLYVDQGNKILRFHAATGRRAAGPDVGAKVLSNSTSVAVGANGNLYANNAGSEGANVAAFGPLVLAPDPRTDNPMVIDSVNDAGTRHTGDFQVTPDGDDGVFVTTIPLTGYANAGHEEVFRYDAPGDAIDCVSCNPTNAQAIGESSLARNGLSLTDDGRVIFNSTDPLVPSDLDNREDVYEWSGETSLISTGLSPFNSSLLSASADGRDAYFFTRDTLVAQDQNGSLVKIYDARENGGFPYTPPPVSCKASDECHGASSPTPTPPAINTITGTRGDHVPEKTKGKCRKGKVKRHGRCVKPHKGQLRKHRHGKRRGGGQR